MVVETPIHGDPPAQVVILVNSDRVGGGAFWSTHERVLIIGDQSAPPRPPVRYGANQGRHIDFFPDVAAASPLQDIWAHHCDAPAPGRCLWCEQDPTITGVDGSLPHHLVGSIAEAGWTHREGWWRTGGPAR